MTEKERLLHILFETEGVSHRNIKFMRGDQAVVTEDAFCREVNSALMQRKTGMIEPLAELPRFKTVDIAKVVAEL